MAQAALGGRFEIPTLDGPEELDLPAGTLPGTEFRLRGQGMPRLRQSGSGDQIVTVKVTVPKKMSSEAREHLQAFAAAMGEAPADRAAAGESEQGSVTDKVKGFFHGRRKKGRDHGADGHDADAQAASGDPKEPVAG